MPTDAPNPRTQATAAGWKMVPVEMTPEMASVIEVNRMFGPKAEFTYRAILAAAPPPPANIGAEGAGVREAMKAAHAALASIVSPGAIKQTSVINAYAQAVEAELMLRKLLAALAEGGGNE